MKKGKIHSHCCGFIPPPSMMTLGLQIRMAEQAADGDAPPDAGCGHVWSHSNDVRRYAKNDDELRAAHMCTKCGRGPWALQYLEQYEKFVKKEMEQVDAKPSDT